MKCLASDSVSDNIPETAVGRLGRLRLRAEQEEAIEDRRGVPEGGAGELRVAGIFEERQQGLDEARVGKV